MPGAYARPRTPDRAAGRTLGDHAGALVVVPRHLVERLAVGAAEAAGLRDLGEEVEADAVGVEPELALEERAQQAPAGQVAEVARVVVRDEAADPDGGDPLDPLDVRGRARERADHVAPVGPDEEVEVGLDGRQAREARADEARGDRIRRHALGGRLDGAVDEVVLGDERDVVVAAAPARDERGHELVRVLRLGARSSAVAEGLGEGDDGHDVGEPNLIGCPDGRARDPCPADRRRALRTRRRRRRGRAAAARPGRARR
jgi:hypothetical protein